MGIRRDGRATRSRGRQRLSAAVQGAAGDGADTACQVTDSPYRFNAISYWDRQAVLAIGYVVLDNPTMPIVGEGDAEPNDTDVPQLIADAQAAVDEVVRRGVTDRAHIAIGWHSYGAFMTANLLAHTRLFKAGIARSGMSAIPRRLPCRPSIDRRIAHGSAPGRDRALSVKLHRARVRSWRIACRCGAADSTGTRTGVALGARWFALKPSCASQHSNPFGLVFDDFALEEGVRFR